MTFLWLPRMKASDLDSVSKVPSQREIRYELALMEGLH